MTAIHTSALHTSALHTSALQSTLAPAPTSARPDAPWNRPGSFGPSARPRHLHLVPAVAPAPARRMPAHARRSTGRLRGLALGLGLAVLVALASLGVLAFLGADAAASTPASSTGATSPAVPVAVAEPVARQWVVVQSGDSLWSVARRLQPRGDVRGLVDRLAERVGTTIIAGQRIDVTGLVG